MKLCEQIRHYITERVLSGGGAEIIDDSTDLLESGILDSLTLVSLIGFLEDTYGVVLGQEMLRAEHFCSVAAIADLVDQQQSTVHDRVKQQ